MQKLDIGIGLTTILLYYSLLLFTAQTWVRADVLWFQDQKIFDKKNDLNNIHITFRSKMIRLS